MVCWGEPPHNHQEQSHFESRHRKCSAIVRNLTLLREERRAIEWGCLHVSLGSHRPLIATCSLLSESRDMRVLLLQSDPESFLHTDSCPLHAAFLFLLLL